MLPTGFANKSPLDEAEPCNTAELRQALEAIIRALPQASVDKLPEILLEIVRAARLTCGLRSGTTALFDYLSNDVYLGRNRSAPVRQSLSEDGPGIKTDKAPPPNRRSSDSVASSATPESFHEVPLVAGGTTLGRLSIIHSDGELKLRADQLAALETLACLAATAIDRHRLQRDSPELKPWLNAFAKVAAASHAASGSENVDAFLEEITDAALEVSRADFAVIYEFFKEGNDVRLPPTISGTPREASVLTDRGVVVEHVESILFPLIERRDAFYAEKGAADWVRAGLMSQTAAKAPRSFFAREDVRSSAGIPLMVEDEPVGVLFINYRKRQFFRSEFRRRFRLFANQAALAIGNKRFFLRSQRYSQNLEALNRIGNRLASAVSNDIEQIGELLDDETHKEIPTHNFFLCIYDEESQKFSLPYIRDKHDNREALEPRLKEGLVARVCRTGKALLLTRKMQDEIFRRGEAKLVGESSAIWLGAPLRLRGKTKGAIVVQDFENETAFHEGHLQLLTAIASQAAIAIDNHGLLRDTRLQLEELAALLTLSQASVSGELTSTEKVSTILDKMCKFADGDGSLLLLVDPGNKNHLKVNATSTALTKYLHRSFTSSEGVLGKVLSEGVPIFENDYRNWPSRIKSFDPLPNLVCAVPLILRGERIGVLTLSSDSQVNQFGNRELEILQRFAGPLVIAIQNSRDVSFRKALIDAGPYPIVAVDVRGHITEFNAEAADLFQYTPQEVRNVEVAKLYFRGAEEARKIQTSLKRNSVIRDEETFVTNRTGQKIPVSLSAALLRDDRGKVIGSVGIMEDLRLRSLRTRTQLLVDTLREISDAEEMSQIVERVVDSAVTLLYADAGCLMLLKDNKFEVAFSFGIDDGVEDRLTSRSAQDTLKELSSTDRSAISFLFKEGSGEALRMMANSKSAVLVRVQTEQRLLAFLLVESRQERHFLGDQKLLRVLASQAAVSINRVQLLRYRERTLRGLLVAANAIAVGQIATTFIHEARNSLNSMNLIARSVAEDIEREPGVKLKKDYVVRLSAIQSEISRFGELSQRLQRFTHLGLVPEKKDAYLNSIVERTLRLLESTLRSKRMKCELKLDPTLGVPHSKGKGHPITVDEHQIQQVIMNLVLNAVAASSERQPILVETRNKPERVECRIQDYGCGIQAEVRKSLFEPFFTTKSDGVGLGLYLSRILVANNHGGSIEIESSIPGKGSTFAIHLPK